MYRNFEDWFGEIENFSTRGERALDALGPEAVQWLKTAWGLGCISAEKTSDGHVAEAAKDVRNAGWPEAADVIEKVTLPQSKRIIDHNIKQIAAEHGITL